MSKGNGGGGQRRRMHSAPPWLNISHSSDYSVHVTAKKSAVEVATTWLCSTGLCLLRLRAITPCL